MAKKEPLRKDKRIAQAKQAIILTADESTVFVEALLNPPEPDPRLRAAAERYRMIMGQS